MEIKDWMKKKDTYEPENDKQKFIDKSIMDFMKILSKIKRNKVDDVGILGKLNPLIKLIGTILIVILLSLSREKFYISIILLFSLLCLCSLSGELLKKILGVSIIIPIFTFIVLLPSIIFMGNVNNSLYLILKVFITIVLVNILSYTTKWNDIVKSLKVLFVPDLFILIFSITINYIYILGEIALNMLYALKLRSVGKNKEKGNSILRIIGNLFLKSKIMAEEMYSAMECRGFTGEYKSTTKFTIKGIDIVYIIILIIILLMFFVI